MKMRILAASTTGTIALLAAAMPAAAQSHAGLHPSAARTGHEGHATDVPATEVPGAVGHGPHASPKSAPPTGHGAQAMPTAETTAPRETVSALTEADRAAAFPPLAPSMAHASDFNTFVLVDRLEGSLGGGDWQAWELSAWAGRDTDRLWLRSEGEREHGRTGSADVELLFGHAISPWWDLVAGIRQASAPGPSRTAAVFGVQGLAPYMFELKATAYLDEGGHSQLKFEAEYELLLTNRLVLQPLLELEANGKDDPAHDMGSGLSRAEFGLRLRYEVDRRFAPYVGWAHERTIGRTADFRGSEGEAESDSRWIIGVRAWF